MNRPESSTTMTLSRWVAATESTDLSADVRHQVRRVLADYFAAAFAGSRADVTNLVREYVARTDHDSSSTVIGTDARLSPAGAALVNGTAAHALDLDDGYTAGACHPGAPICSAVLAAAEPIGSTADDVVRAIALGYEVACRIASASHPAQRRRGFHNTALVGTFGATVGVAALRCATTDQIHSAFGNAASHCGGLLSFLDDGTDLKRLHAGKAARDGLVCAELSLAGLRGPAHVLEAAHGYFAAFTGNEADLDHVTDHLGDRWRMLDTYNKPYPCCRHVHGAIDVALEIRERDGFAADRIESIQVDTFAIAAEHDGVDIHNTLDAQMSLPYAVAVALLDGSVEMTHFGDQWRSDPRLAAIMRTVRVREEASLTAAYPAHRPAKLVVRSAGTEFAGEVLQPYGEPGNPMTDADLEQKLRSFVGPVHGPDRTAALAAWIWSFDGGPVPWPLLATSTAGRATEGTT